MTEANLYKILAVWFVIYWVTYAIWLVFLHKKYDGNRNTIGTWLGGGVLCYLCCCAGWAFMAWMYFAPDEQIPASLKKC